MSNKSQQISYLRIGNSSIAWFFLRVQPVKFGAMMVLADGLSVLELLFQSGSTSPYSDKMLRCVADMMWSTMLIFAGLQVVSAQPEEARSSIDLNMMCFQMGLMFLLLFVSQWFKFYSLNLAGDRKDKVGTGLEKMLLSLTITDAASLKNIER